MRTATPTAADDHVDGTHGGELGPLRTARWHGERRESVVRGTRIRYRVEEDARSRWPGDAVRLFEDRPIADDAPDQQAIGGQARIEAGLLAVLQEVILAAVGANEDRRWCARGLVGLRDLTVLLEEERSHIDVGKLRPIGLDPFRGELLKQDRRNVDLSSSFDQGQCLSC